MYNLLLWQYDAILIIICNTKSYYAKQIVSYDMKSYYTISFGIEYIIQYHVYIIFNYKIWYRLILYFVSLLLLFFILWYDTILYLACDIVLYYIISYIYRKYSLFRLVRYKPKIRLPWCNIPSRSVINF